MLSPKENFLETLKKDGRPDRLVNQFEACCFIGPDPVTVYVKGKRYRGMPPGKDKWGTTILWPEDQPGGMPYITDETKVVRDICRWREYTTVPDIVGYCSDPAVWVPALEAVSKVDRNIKMSAVIVPTGLFEQLHHLMGFEDTLVNFLAEPEAMEELCAVVGEYRYNYIRLIVDNIKPDIIISHDDWGSKHNLFMSPEVWRKYIKPQYKRVYQYLHEKGVIVIHHADSFLEPIIEDMADINIDIWQGVLPQNDIKALQRKLNGRMVLMGGIDASIVDRVDSTEEEIRKEVRRACEEYGPGGHFIPCLTYGAPGAIYPHVDAIIDDEIKKYNEEVYGIR